MSRKLTIECSLLVNAVPLGNPVDPDWALLEVLSECVQAYLPGRGNAEVDDLLINAVREVTAAPATYAIDCTIHVRADSDADWPMLQRRLLRGIRLHGPTARAHHVRLQRYAIAAFAMTDAR